MAGWTIYDDAAPESSQLFGWWDRSHVQTRGGALVLTGSPGMTPEGRRYVTGGAGLYRHAQVYGRNEARVRFTACAAAKYVLLLWPVSGNWPAGGEIDFAEDEGGNRDRLSASVLFPSSNPARDAASQTQTINPEGGLSVWHTVGVEWMPGAIRFTVDGRTWGAPVTAHVPHDPMAFAIQMEGLPGSGDAPAGCDGYLQWVRQYAYHR